MVKTRSHGARDRSDEDLIALDIEARGTRGKLVIKSQKNKSRTPSAVSRNSNAPRKRSDAVPRMVVKAAVGDVSPDALQPKADTAVPEVTTADPEVPEQAPVAPAPIAPEAALAPLAPVAPASESAPAPPAAPANTAALETPQSISESTASGVPTSGSAKTVPSAGESPSNIQSSSQS